jgi:HSP20 family molecular chaperone IbpA
MRDLFGRFTENWALPADLARISNQFVPRIDVRDVGDCYQVTPVIPGMTEKDLDVAVEHNTLTFQGDKRNEFEDKGKVFWQSEIS